MPLSFFPSDSGVIVYTGGMHPADILLVFASKENDTPKVEELLKAGADPNIKVCFVCCIFYVCMYYLCVLYWFLLYW